MIYIIITTSINNKADVQDDIHRRKRYIDSIEQILNLTGPDVSIKPIIVENNGLRHTYLDNLNCSILYTDNNKVNCPHKGGNELLDIKNVIAQYKIQDDDIIIKLTGRYKLLSSSFLELVKNNANNYEAFVKFYNVCKQTYEFDDCVLGLFAVKCKYLKDFNYKFTRSPECEFADYIRVTINKDKLIEVQDLDLECCFADDLRILKV